MMIRSRYSFSILALAVFAMFVLSACGPRASATPDGIAGTKVDLPALVVEYDASGEASLFGQPVSQLGDTLGADLSALSLGEETVQALMANNIQHLQIDKRPGGLIIYANGRALPLIVWDDAAVAALGEALPLLGAEDAADILPILTILDVGLALKFPVASGQSAIALARPSSLKLDVAAATGILDQARATGIAVNAAVVYAEDGTFQITGLNPLMVGFIPTDALTLSPETVADMGEQGVENVSVTTTGSGLLLGVNGQTLPYIQWSSLDDLTTMLTAIGAMQGEGPGGSMAGVAAQLQTAGIILNFAGMQFNVVFPQ